MVQKIQVASLFLILPLAALFLYAYENGLTLREIFAPAPNVIDIGKMRMQVEVADTDLERMRGLSGRKELPETVGLLMIFDEPGIYGIWMKDMNFPIDVIWISEELEVVGITEQLTPSSYPKVFRPPVPVKYVIETNVGYSNTFGIRVGDAVLLPPEKLDRD